MKTIRILHGLSLAAVFSLGPAAQVFAQGTAFTYQGRLNDGAAPANGSYDLTFALFAVAAGGSPIAGPLTNSAAVSNGLFTVTLDLGANFPGADRWLEIGARTNGGGAFTSLIPRQKITATPYAATASNVTGPVTASQLSGSVSLANLPTAVLVTNGQTGVNLTGSFSGNGAGVTNVNLVTVNAQGAIGWVTNFVGNFALASSPGVGNGPYSVTAADVNGDGKLDLISANYFANTLTVLTNNGSGGFVLASTLGVGSHPYSVAAADVNGDGRVDLVSANFNANTLSVLTNDGLGGFVLASSPAVGLEPWPVIAADVNADGRIDLITANYGSYNLSVLTNSGGGIFVLASSPSVGFGAISVTAADVNGDAKVDLICANSTDYTLTVLTNKGSGVFVLASTLGVGRAPFSVASADVNGDGKVDLISANADDNALTVLTNNGSGVFVLASSPAVGAGPVSVKAADVNGDGKVDLVTANFGQGGGHTLTVLTNNGAGGFVLASSPGVGASPWSVVAADVNGDGGVDLISANAYDNTLTVLFNAPNYTGKFKGDGSALTGLNASSLVSGTMADARLSTNVALLSGSQIFNGPKALTNSGNNFAGSGASLTSLNASAIASGTVADARLSSNVALLSGIQTFSGAKAFTNSANSFTGNGAGLIGVPPAAGSASYIQNQTASDQAASFRINGNGIFNGGSVGIGTISPGYLLQVGDSPSPAYCDGTSWVNGSDRNFKRDFKAINAREVLEKVAALPITEWRYSSDASAARHVGPMAQDFHAAFTLNGPDNRHISTVDEGGIALAAIQGLNEKLETAERTVQSQIEKLQAENLELKQRLAKLEQLLDHKPNGMRP